MASEAALIDLAYARALPLVATNPANFVEPQFHPAHDAMLCIAQSAYVESEDRRASNPEARSEEHTSELQSLMRISYAVFCLQKTQTTFFSPTITSYILT